MSTLIRIIRKGNTGYRKVYVKSNILKERVNNGRKKYLVKMTKDIK